MTTRDTPPEDTTSWTLPASWYRDPAIFEAERRAVFAREWLWVGIEEHVREPGAYLSASPAQFPIVVQRGDDGVLRGFHNVCRHRASPLVTEPRGACREFACPYHGWRYRQDGSLRALPSFERAPDFPREKLGLIPIRVACWRGAVFVNLDVEAEDLEPRLAPFDARLEELGGGERVFHDERSFDVACNWKTYVDNYQEGYHVPVLHPTLARDLDWRRYKVENVPHGSVHTCPSAAGSEQPGVFGWVFPNFTIITYGTQVSFMRIEPHAPGRSRLVYSFFRGAGQDPEVFEKDVRYGMDVSKEDQWLTPLIQRNLEAGVYERGPLNSAWENGVFYFHELLRAALQMPLG